MSSGSTQSIEHDRQPGSLHCAPCVPADLCSFSRQIEESLRGTIYDSYIRLMLWEGVRQWWRSSISTWLMCPSAGLDEAFQVASWPLQVVDQLAFSHESPDLSPVVCPVSWATETHKYTCALAFPPGLIPGHVPELYTKEYYGPIRGVLRFKGAVLHRQALTQVHSRLTLSRQQCDREIIGSRRAQASGHSQRHLRADWVSRLGQRTTRSSQLAVAAGRGHTGLSGSGTAGKRPDSPFFRWSAASLWCNVTFAWS